MFGPELVFGEVFDKDADYKEDADCNDDRSYGGDYTEDDDGDGDDSDDDDYLPPGRHPPAG